MVYVPRRIKAWNPETGKLEVAELVGEHANYLVYEFTSTGRRVLVNRGDVLNYEIF